MSDLEVPLRLECRRGHYCCLTRGLVQYFQLTGQCGTQKFPLEGGCPFTERLVSPQAFSPTNWILLLEFSAYTSGSHSHSGAGKANGANCASAQAVILGQGCGAVSKT